MVCTFVHFTIGFVLGENVSLCAVSIFIPQVDVLSDYVPYEIQSFVMLFFLSFRKYYQLQTATIELFTSNPFEVRRRTLNMDRTCCHIS